VDFAVVVRYELRREAVIGYASSNELT